jgi:AraC-like DNA-binding protein
MLNIKILHSPSIGYGLNVTEEFVRLLYFEEAMGIILIDNHSYNIRNGNLCIVPSRHFHYFTKNDVAKFICIDIPLEFLTPIEQALLLKLKYSDSKKFDPKKDTNEVQIVLSGLNNLKTDSEIIKSLYYHVFNSYIFERTFLDKNITAKNLSIALLFLELLRTCNLSLDFSLNEIINSLNCSERTLRRTCLNIFGYSPNSILKYHIMLNSILLILNKKYSISQTSKHMGFSSISAFNRYLKRYLKYPPSELANLFKTYE